MFPCDAVLHLKIRAQVMFIRDDTEGGAYCNGTLAIVERIDGGEITVPFRDSGEEYTLHAELWENIGFRTDEKTGRIIREAIGTFRQYPLRLAWAITIHKSPGLTFDKVVVDAGRSFAAGQVYVALSRCRSLEGIVLHSPITPSAFHDVEAVLMAATDTRPERLNSRTSAVAHSGPRWSTWSRPGAAYCSTSGNLGAGNETRTRDLNLGNIMRCRVQLHEYYR
jgi:ATP-dependent exoDNAse (exonuclease V) alpha subunit